MKAVIVGAGHISRIHAPYIASQPGNRIAAVVDRDLVRAEALAREIGVEKWYAELAAALEAEKPDVVHVLTPPQYHAEPAIQALEHGCHVYVEKPMATTSADCRRMIAAARAKNVQLCVNHNMVFLDPVQKALALARKGQLGEIVSVDVELVFNPARMQAYTEDGAEFTHWIYKLNGGPLEDLMPHPLSIVLELLDGIDDMRYVTHRAGVLPGGWNDEIRVDLRSGRRVARISVSLNERPDTMLVTIKGRKGRVTADTFTGIVTVQKRSCLPRAAVRGLLGFRLSWQYFAGAVVNLVRFLAGRIDKSNGIGPLTERFYKALSERTDMPVDPEKALRQVELIERIWPEPQVKVEPVQPPPAPPADAPLVLVTGATGFVGIHLVRRLLDSGLRVRALVRKNSLHAGRLRALNVDVVEGDLADADVVDRAVQGAKRIYHLGAAMSNDWNEHERTTIRGTRHVVDAALKHGVERMVFVSTLAVYELLDKAPRSLINESSPCQIHPRRMGPYAWSKIEAERIVQNAVGDRDLKATIVRLGMVVGPLSRVFYPHLGFKLGADVFIPIGRGNMVLPLVHVGNAVDGILAAAESENAIGDIYNLVDEGEVTVNQYLETFIRVTGADSKIVHMPYWVAWSIMLAYECAAAVGLVKKGVTSRAQLKWKQSDMRYDSSKARRDFQWRSRVPLAEAMEETFKWYARRYGV